MFISTFVKGFVYVALAILTSLYAVNGQLTTHEMIGAAMSGLIALRSFMDQSIGIGTLINSNSQSTVTIQTKE